MNYYFKLQLFCACVISLFMFLTVRGVNKEKPFWGPELGFSKYKTFTNILLLPTYLCIYILMNVWLGSWDEAVQWLLIAGFGLLFQITLYYILLIPLQVIFRRYFQARTCAMLWIMPTCLYICLIGDITARNRPLLVISGSLKTVQIAGIIWAAGFLAVMVWKIFSHLWFRHQIVSSSREITDETILTLWTAEQTAAGMHPLLSLKPVYSDVVQTPLSIGFMDTTILLVLPDRPYTEADLRLIFRHEIVHIQRKDAQTKLLTAFCTALCWFNPFMWKSLENCSADLELSCDETVLADADEATRRHYGQLLLRTAGSSRGFTTCLSASAETLRYRLKHVMMPRRGLRTGGFIIAALTFLLIISVGFVSLSYEQLPVSQVLSDKELTAGISAQTAAHYSAPGYGDCQITGTEELNQYIQSIEVHKITGYYRFEDSDRYLSLPYVTKSGREVTLFLSENSLKLDHYSSHLYWDIWYISQDIDWDYIESLLEPVSG